MSASNLFELSAAVLASVGSAGAIIFGLSSWLGKVWATRLMDSERHRNRKELTKITEEIRKAHNIEIEKLKSELDFSSHN